MTRDEIYDTFEKHGLRCGRIISGGKTSPPGCKCVWNANVISPSISKLWYGDINLTREGDKLKKVAADIGETLYVLRESDARFGTETAPVQSLLNKAVWSTDKATI
jgi:hypothetical protein